MIQVFGPWEAASTSYRGLVPTSWNMDPVFHVLEPNSGEAKDRALNLYEVPYDCRNWSCWLNPYRPAEPPTLLRPEIMDRDDSMSLSDTGREEIDAEAKR